MKSTWLIIDATQQCYRSFYAIGKLTQGEVRTEVLFGFLRETLHLQDIYATRNVVFAFDCGRSLRALHYPQYKSHRHVRNEDEQRVYDELQDQITLLRREYLYEIGYCNVLWEKGYEADDIIASVVENLNDDEDAVIVSSDHDMFQLLSPRCILYKPSQKEVVTVDSFCREYGVSPSQWVDVKAIAGCSTDEVEGIRGIGEKTAAKFINGTLKAGTKAYEKIVMGDRIWKRNKQLVKLPYPGLEPFELLPDKITRDSWDQFAIKYGLETLRDTQAAKPRRR